MEDYRELTEIDFRMGILLGMKVPLDWRDVKTAESAALSVQLSESNPQSWPDMGRIRWVEMHRDEIGKQSGESDYLVLRTILNHFRNVRLLAYVMKDSDDYFWVVRIWESRVAHGSNYEYEYFKCDQHHGLVRCLRDARI